MELKKIDLPSGAIAYLKPELSSGDYDDIQSLFLENVDIKFSPDGKPNVGDLKLKVSTMTLAKYKLLSIGTVKIERGEEKTEPVTMEFLRGMSVKDIEFLIKEADKIYKASSLDDDIKKK